MIWIPTLLIHLLVAAWLREEHLHPAGMMDVTGISWFPQVQTEPRQEGKEMEGDSPKHERGCAQCPAGALRDCCSPCALTVADHRQSLLPLGSLHPSCSRAGVKPGNESPAALCLSPCPALGPFLPSCVWVGNKGALIPVEIKTCCLPAQLGGHKEICVSSHSLAIPLKASLLIYTYICSLLYVAFTTYEMETL